MAKRSFQQDSDEFVPENFFEGDFEDDKISFSGIFKDDEMPEDVFPIGDSVFVRVCTYRQEVIIHIRRYKKHRTTHYPTSEGVTLQPDWIETIMGRENLPQTIRDLRALPKKDIQITSKDFEHFTFIRRSCGKSVSITLSASQWLTMMHHYVPIASYVLNHVFFSMNFLTAFKLYHEGHLEECLPSSFDVSLGTQYLNNVLETVLRDLLLEKGLKEPQIMAEEVWANRLETFISGAFSLDVDEIAKKFCQDLLDSQNFLCVQPITYVTGNFCRNLRLDCILNSVKNSLCPPSTFEYFEVLEPAVGDYFL